MKKTNIESKGEYVSPSCSCIRLEPASVICTSGLIDDMDTLLIDDSIWNIW